MPSGVPDVSWKGLSPSPSACHAGGCQKREPRLNGDGCSVVMSLFHVCQWIIPHRLNSERVSMKIRLPTDCNGAPLHAPAQTHVSRVAAGAALPSETRDG